VTYDKRKIAVAVLEKYSSDPAFKAKLLDNPRSALAESGLLAQVTTKYEEECGGPNTCSKTCGFPTCNDTCGVMSCVLST